MKIRIAGIFLAAVIALSSCANPDKIADQIKVKSFAGIESHGYSRATLRFDVENGSRKTIHLRGGQLTINDGKKTLVRIKADDITIRKRTSGIVELPLRVSLNQMQMLISLGKLAQRPGEFTVSGEVKVKSGMLSKKFNFADEPLDKFLKSIGLTDEDFRNMIE